jgi:hypothetical protein
LGALNENGLLRWDESFLDGSFAPAKKGALRSAKPSGARERSGWYWQTVKVFRWEFGWKVPLRQKLRLRKPRWVKSRSRKRGAVHDKSRSGDRRRRVRFRSPAPAAQEAGYRTDRPLSQEQQETAVRRWTQTPPLQAALDRRTNQCVAGAVPEIVGSS